MPRTRARRGPLSGPVSAAMAKKEYASVQVAEPPEPQEVVVVETKTHHGICSICGHEQRSTNPQTEECPMCASMAVVWKLQPIQPLSV